MNFDSIKSNFFAMCAFNTLDSDFLKYFIGFSANKEYWSIITFSVKQKPRPTAIIGTLYFLAAKATIKDPGSDITAPFFNIDSADIIILSNFLILEAT